MSFLILQAKNISKSFAGSPVLSDINLDIEQGKIFGLLGPNGAGKTTFIRIINQIIKQDDGEMRFENKPLSIENQLNIGYLPEERGLYKKMKVGEQAVFLGRLKGLSKNEATKRLKEQFEKFDIMPWWNKKVEELSKGMQQKIQFIITILHRPGLLIFDEPFSGFDPINANLLKNEIIQLKENGTSIIFSTHNMNSVEELCDHIALVNKGRLVLKGAVNNLKNKYKTGNFSVSLRGDKPIPATEGVEVIKEKNETTGKSITIKPDNKKNINNYITALMKTHEVISFQENLPGMEEIFIRAVENKLEP